MCQEHLGIRRKLRHRQFREYVHTDMRRCLLPHQPIEREAVHHAASVSAVAFGRRAGRRSTLIVWPHSTPGGSIAAITVRSLVAPATSRHAARKYRALSTVCGFRASAQHDHISRQRIPSIAELMDRLPFMQRQITGAAREHRRHQFETSRIIRHVQFATQRDAPPVPPRSKPMTIQEHPPYQGTSSRCRNSRNVACSPPEHR